MTSETTTEVTNEAIALALSYIKHDPSSDHPGEPVIWSFPNGLGTMLTPDFLGDYALLKEGVAILEDRGWTIALTSWDLTVDTVDFAWTVEVRDRIDESIGLSAASSLLKAWWTSIMRALEVE